MLKPNVALIVQFVFYVLSFSDAINNYPAVLVPPKW